MTVPPTAWRRGIRLTLTACAVFYVCRYLIGDPVLAVYAVFATIAFGLLSDVAGPPAQRTRTLLTCLAVGLVVVVVATYAAATTWSAVLGMFVAGFLVAFASVGGVQVVEVSAGLQLLFILPSSPPYDPGSLGSRLLGLSLGLLALTVADRVLLPNPAPPGFLGRLRDAIAAVCLFADGLLEGSGPDPRVDGPEVDRRMEAARHACSRLRLLDVPLPERPSGPSTRDRGLTQAAAAVQTVFGRLAALREELDEPPEPVLLAVRSCLGDVRQALDGSGPAPTTEGLESAVTAERERWRALLTAPSSSAATRHAGSLAGAATLVAAVQVAEASRVLVLAVRAVIGAQVPEADATPDGPFWYAERSPLALLWRRIRGNLTPRSVALQNALRLGFALAVARFIVAQLDLSHGFWVLLATLTLMRTSVRATRGALGPALLGTLLGGVATAALLLAAGDHQAVYIVVLPICLFLAVIAPPVLGVRIGVMLAQACFTLVVASLFSQVSPPTWRLAEARVVDVLVGAAVGILAGALAWPRGGRAETRRAGSRCLRAAAACIDTTVEWLVGAAPASALSDRLAEIRLAMVFFDRTYAQYRSEPADHADSTDWLAVGVATIRAARGAAAARRWSDGTSDLPWRQLRLDIETTGHHIADEYRYAATAVESGEPPVRGSAPDEAAIRAGLAETAAERDRGAHPDGTLRAVEAWGWLWWLSDDLNRLRAEPDPNLALQGR